MDTMTTKTGFQTRIENMPTSFRKAYEKSRKSKAFAIKSFCAECTGYDRKAIRDCTDNGCPLWPHRPFQTKIFSELADREEEEEEETQCCDDPNVKRRKDGKLKKCMSCGKKWRIE